jgi:hypothetical protein
MKAAYLFWKKLTADLVKWGFVINPYDMCVANKMINGKQCTVVWHVDDVKISHVDPNVVTDVIALFSAEYAKMSPLTISRGKIHEYLGMTLDYSVKGKVKITMTDYVINMLKELPADMEGVAATPASPHLFTVNTENPTLLDTEQSEMFHRNVAKLLFLCKRARPDIQTAISFLCTRVKKPDTDDYKKLARVMKYLRGSIDLPLMLEADHTQVIKWWADGSFAVHPDMRSHTGGAMSMGKGAVYATSTRQKLNTRSSTEAEVVAAYDVLPQLLWTRHFLQEQGYEVSETVLHQDNQSAMLMETNGRLSSSKRTRHMHIRFFWIADHVQSGKIKLEYCPTGVMLADYFTKPLQGAAFYKF